ncbi:hypothetical protein C0991_006714 [Blastosporella zonata]|nr:hypothetical protein C0991_006714 [Blastosporella zonata]
MPYFGQPKTAPSIPPVKIEETKKRFADMDHKLETVLATLQKLTTNGGSINNGAPQTGRCLFCGKTGHTIHTCYEADRYLQSGQAIQRNNKITLPSGATIPGPFGPGNTLQSKIDDYHRNHPGQTAANTLSGNTRPDEEQRSGVRGLATTMLYGISGNTNEGATQHLSNNTSGASQVINDRITALQQEIQALQKKQDIFDGVKIPRAKPFSKTPLPKSGPSVTFEKEPAVIPTPNRSRASKSLPQLQHQCHLSIPMLAPTQGINQRCTKTLQILWTAETTKALTEIKHLSWTFTNLKTFLTSVSAPQSL